MLLSYGLQAHTNVHILYYLLKTGEGVLHVLYFLVFTIFTQAGKMNFLRGQETFSRPLINQSSCAICVGHIIK